MKKVVLLSGLLAFSAFAANPSTEAIATLNGKPLVTMADVNNFMKKAGIDPTNVAVRQRVEQGLVQRAVLLMDAKKHNVDKDPALKEDVNEFRNDLIVKMYAEKIVKAKPVTDAELKALYDKEFSKSNEKKEYDVRHILVPDEATAEKIIKELTAAKPANFAELAKKYSKDPGSAKNGGELGWSDASMYVKPFAEAVMSAKADGKPLPKPVKTQFGYHVIEVEGVRDVQPPSFDEVKADLTRAVQAQRLNNYMEKLLKPVKFNLNVPTK